MSPVWRVALKGRIGDFELNVAFESEARCIVLIGPNGAGKSSIARAIIGGAPWLDSRIEIGGTSVKHTEDAPTRIGFVPQSFGLFPHLTVRRNVAFGLASLPEEARTLRTEQTLAAFELEHLVDRRAHRLSGGEQQRVALARAAAVDPVALVLDEPLASLDPAHRRRARTALQKHLAESERPALWITHDARDLTESGIEVIVIEGGQVQARGTPAELAGSPPSEFVEEFFALGPSPHLAPAST